MRSLHYRAIRISAMLLASMCVPAFSQSDKVAEGAKKDLLESQNRLTQQRQSLNAERIKLSVQMRGIQSDLLEARRQVRLARMSGFDRKEMMRELEQKAAVQSAELAFLERQLKTYYLKFTTHLVKGESAGAAENLGAELDATAKQMLALEAGLSRLENLVGGGSVAAEAVDASGRVRKGKLVMVGPAMWFASNDGEAAGAVVLSKGNNVARIVAQQDGVTDLMDGKEIVANIDLTGGKARALANLDESPLDLFRKGGVWLYPILAVALLALGCAVMKMIQLSKIKQPDHGWLSAVLERLRGQDVAGAIQLSEGLHHPIGEVMRHALTGAEKGADVVEEIIYERMIDVQSQLKKWLPFIAVTAAIAPLLGLLGTVSGMINTFRVITVAGTGDPQTLAGGISEALVTTMFGLIVAIPALVLHSLLSRRSQGIIQTTEKLGLTVVNSIRKEEK